MRVLATLIAVATLLGAGTASAAEQPPAVDPAITDGSAQRALDRARAQWKAATLRSYSEGVRLSCFCPQTRVVWVIVRGGRPAAKTPARLRDVATVPRQFLLVQRAIDKRYAGLTVRYGRRGNPVALELDPVANLADEESYYAFTQLRAR